MTTPQRRVHFNRDISKFSVGSKTPTIERLSSNSSVSQTPSYESAKKISTIQQQHDKSNNDNNQITVAVRIRPLNNKESFQGYHNAVRVNETEKEICVNDRSNKPLKFTCDYIITEQKSPNLPIQDTVVKDSDLIGDSQQKYVYECIGKPLLEKAYDGYNVSIFAYGQTGSGKTYSMIGTDKQPGLIPRFFDELFQRKTERDQIVSSTHIEISYYEIYNEKIYDLLRSTPTNDSKENSKTPVNGRNLQIRENPQTGPYIVDLLTLSANSASDAKLWLDIGNKRRATACTNMNQKSSRSHSVFQINLTQMLEHQSSTNDVQKIGDNGSKLLQLVTSKINLVDLAGSERINSAFTSSSQPSSSTLFSSSSTASNTQLTSNRFKESTCINKSLLTLGKIICLLSERQSGSSSVSANLPSNGNNNAAIINSSSAGSTNGYLPYRESVLTWLLKESLGGNAKTAMLATVNCSSCYIDETICTLRYAAKTACIKNLAHLNRNFKQKYINEFGQEKEMNLVLNPNIESSLLKKNDELQLTLKLMEQEWKEKLEEAEKLKQKEINDLEKSLIVLYENEIRAQNCCLINLNEDPSLSEKLIYLLKSKSAKNENNIETLIGSDKNLVNIMLTGALIGPVHCRIINEIDLYFIEQMDENYVTYLNGEVIQNGQRYQLNHGDRIIFGGSHFFRFNNPKSLTNKQQTTTNANKNASNNNLSDQFKDYQFAKNEIEKKQNELIQKKLNEALTECKRDGDMKIKELRQQYEKNIESIKNDLEREKSARKAELELIKSENQKKLKKIVEKKILIEKKLNIVENQVVETNKEIDKHEKELIDDTFSSYSSENSVFRTPSANSIANRRFINKLYSDKKNSAYIRPLDQEIVQFHASSNCLFSIALRVTEANKICNALGFEYELKRFEIVDSSNSTNQESIDTSFSQINQKNYIQAISVVDKRLKLITLWNLDTFEFKLNMLREMYNRYIEDGSISSSASGQNESIFLTDSMDEWQKLDAFNQNDTFSPRVIENAIGRRNDKKSCKRRLSIMSANNNMNNNLSSNNNNNLIKSTNKTEMNQIDEDQIDSANDLIKRKLQTPLIQTPLQTSKILPSQQTPLIPFTPGSIVKSKTTENQLNSSFDITNQLTICNAFVYATCRDALNDDDFQIDDEDDLLDEMDDDNEDFDDNVQNTNSKNLKSLPIMDDVYLKYYARLIYNLNKLMELNLSFNSNENKKFNDDDNLNGNNDQPLYCMKIIMLYSQLSQFKPDYWSLVNGENLYKIKKIYFKINKLLKSIKDSINCLFQSIENNLDSMAKSKYELLINQVSKLINFHGEYIFLTCSNTFLNRSSYSLIMIDSKFLYEYSKGIDKQFDEFLSLRQNETKIPISDCLKTIKNFWISTQRSKMFSDNLPSSDLIIDYCNFMLQSHFRLSNIFKILKHKDQIDEPKLKNKLTEQILNLFYNIITDSLSLYTTLSVDESDDNDDLNKEKWSDSFLKCYKELKSFLKNTAEVNSIKERNIKLDVTNTKENSILDTCRLSFDNL